jgi:hypothetical protein
VDKTTKNYVLDFLKDKKDKIKSVLEIGSKDRNGSVRIFFDNIANVYHGVDLEYGKDVDIVGHLCNTDTYKQLDKEYDLVLCLNVLEHDVSWRSTLVACLSKVKVGGSLLIVQPSYINCNTLLFLKCMLRPTEDLNDPNNNLFLLSSYWPSESDLAGKRLKHVGERYKDWVMFSYLAKTAKDFLSKVRKTCSNFEGQENFISKHLCFESILSVSHNVHETDENGYYGNVSLGEILEIITFTNCLNKFDIDADLNMNSGLQYCLTLTRHTSSSWQGQNL